MDGTEPIVSCRMLCPTSIVDRHLRQSRRGNSLNLFKAQPAKNI